MRLFAALNFLAAIFYCATTVQAMRTGTIYPLSGHTSGAHLRGDPSSRYERLLFAHWLLVTGLVATGIAVTALAKKYEKLEDRTPSQ